MIAMSISPKGSVARNWLVREANVMFSEDRSDWRLLCKQAANETDLTRLLELTAEIVRLLDEQRERSMPVGLMN
jgi:hypothetical protein